MADDFLWVFHYLLINLGICDFDNVPLTGCAVREPAAAAVAMCKAWADTAKQDRFGGRRLSDKIG